ncbi:hypothetical protein BJ138DRAFT_1219367 [Hygrophoropsis aurantiaca]|uniref:Uncharacterized protein n=1 Tax=Hygrophoropsis aurantiaca TaxID=72124 RepID=A0ACB7ZZU7_9AGAM|nr:hypothetical protein BJ138DRAFT_1219367 [Hygrophoropsis aurantiaca]
MTDTSSTCSTTGSVPSAAQVHADATAALLELISRLSLTAESAELIIAATLTQRDLNTDTTEALSTPTLTTVSSLTEDDAPSAVQPSEPIISPIIEVPDTAAVPVAQVAAVAVQEAPAAQLPPLPITPAPVAIVAPVPAVAPVAQVAVVAVQAVPPPPIGHVLTTYGDFDYYVPDAYCLAPYYLVTKGRRVGVFSQWQKCSPYVTGVAGAVYSKARSVTHGRDIMEEAIDSGEAQVLP